MSECHYSQTYSCPVFRGFSTGTEQRAGRKNKWDVHGKRKKLRKTWRRGARERRRNSEEEGKQAGRGSERPWDLVRFVEHSLGGGSSMADRSTPTPTHEPSSQHTSPPSARVHPDPPQYLTGQVLQRTQTPPKLASVTGPTSVMAAPPICWDRHLGAHCGSPTLSAYIQVSSSPGHPRARTSPHSALPALTLAQLPTL